MIFEKKGWYRLTLPDGWEADEEEEGVVAIYAQDGAGALQVSAQTPRPLPPGGKIDVFLMLRAFLKQTGVEFVEEAGTRRTEKGIDWASYEHTDDSGEEELLYRSWMATNHDILVFMTYACPTENGDAERAAVDGIVASLEIR